jgi:hypothetical protein
VASFKAIIQIHQEGQSGPPVSKGIKQVLACVQQPVTGTSNDDMTGAFEGAVQCAAQMPAIPGQLLAAESTGGLLD